MYDKLNNLEQGIILYNKKDS